MSSVSNVVSAGAKAAVRNPFKYILSNVIEEQRKKEEEKNIWRDSSWKAIATLESNNVGIVGEQFVQRICNECNIPAAIDGATTKELGGGAGDGTINGKTVEIKCARQGTGYSRTFQHELGEKPWNADYMLFLDIAPENFYLTIMPNMTEEQYKTKQKFPQFPSRTPCWRKGSGAFKLDTTVSLNEKQAVVANPYTLVWTPQLAPYKIQQFINRIVTPSAQQQQQQEQPESLLAQILLNLNQPQSPQ